MTTELVQTRLAFDYEALDSETRIVVRQRTGEIRERMRQTAQSIVEIGQRLAEVKDRLPHGQFGPWLAAEFEMTEGHARKMMQVARAFGAQNDHYDRFAPTALYLLAAPSTPEEAREEAQELAAAGEQVTPKKAEEVIQKHKPAPAARAGGGGAAARPAPPPERREADEMDGEELSPYEQQLAARQPTPAPAAEPEVIADVPAAPSPAPTLTPIAPAGPTLTPLQPTTTTDVDLTQLRQAAALVALLDQALNLATLDLAQLQHKAGPEAPIYSLPDDAVEAQARLFYASPGLKAAAGFLAMRAIEQKEAA